MALAAQTIYEFVKLMKELPLQNDSYSKINASSTIQTNHKRQASNVLQRAGEGDRAAVKDCIDKYGDFIWAMAKKFTDSTEDAESVTQEIFLNIWRHAARFERTDYDELLFITIIARRQLRKYSDRFSQSIN